MQLWIQLRDHDEDVEFSDAATYQVHSSGVLRVNSGNDIHLYSPAYWQHVVIDTRSHQQRESNPAEIDDDLQWQ